MIGRPHLLFQVEKLRQAAITRSPLRWFYCGVIRARTLEEAASKAAYVVGSSLVRVKQVEDDA